jgi:hypothetical protein
MGTDAVSPLRQLMIEDMNARKALCRHAERPHSQLPAVRRVSQAVS